jgi:hypothetical protein
MTRGASVLVTGAAGLRARHLVNANKQFDALILRGATCRSFDRPSRRLKQQS